MVDVVDPTPEEIQQAHADFERVKQVLAAADRAGKRALVGKCLRYPNRDGEKVWFVYFVVTGIAEDGELTGWWFQHAPNGLIQVMPLSGDYRYDVEFFGGKCETISRSECIVAFNELLTAVARVATVLP